MRATIRIATLAGLMLIAGGNVTRAADLDVLASNAIKAALSELGPKFESASGNKIKFSFKAAAELKVDIEKGAPVDVAILTSAAIDELIKQGRLTAAGKADIAGSNIGVAIRKGAAKPDISNAEAFKRTLLAVKSVGYVEQGATGAYLKQLFDKLGVTQALAGKIVLLPSENPAAKAVGNGEAEIGITQVSEILPYATAELVGPLPPELQQITIFTAGIGSGTRHAEAANALIAFLRTAPSAAVLMAKGLEPR